MMSFICFLQLSILYVGVLLYEFSFFYRFHFPKAILNYKLIMEIYYFRKKFKGGCSVGEISSIPKRLRILCHPLYPQVCPETHEECKIF
jgi:hypothetical protein